MNETELFKALVTELLKEDELHEEYQDNDVSIVIDGKKTGNTLNISITSNKNKDKEEFEKWLSNVDDELFQEVLEQLGNIEDINELYKTENYKEVIDKVKSKTRELAKKKINKLKLVF